MNLAKQLEPALTPPLGAILSCRGYADIGKRLLEPTARHLGTSSSVFFQFSQSGLTSSRLGRHSYCGEQNGAVDIYVDNDLYREDPCYRETQDKLAHSGGQGSQLIQLSEIKGWRKSSYNAEFLKPFDVSDVLSLVVPVRSAFETTLMCISFHKEHGQFRASDAARLQALAPALETVLTNIAYADALSLSKGLVEAFVVDGEAAGIVVLESDLSIRHANRQGLVHLGLVKDDEPASPGHSDAFGALQLRLTHAATRETAVNSFNLEAEDLSVETTSFSGPLGEKLYLVVTLESRDRRRISSTCQAFGLSARETQITALVCGGQSNASIASQLSIAVRTVENHLRSIFAKVEVGSRTQLVSKIVSHG